MADTGFLIAGLGNPGQKYQATRHNAGFIALDHYADTIGCSFSQTKWQGEYCRGRLNGNRLLLVKPQTYMNRSGECIRSFVDYFNVSLENILVLHDDLDLPAGRIKVVARGGAGGHNGIRSIIQHLGSTDFARLKIGIGRPEANEEGNGMPVERYVLTRFAEKELHDFHAQLELAIEAVELFIHEGVDFCMNRINGR